MEVLVQGPARDLHSGHYGGNVHNPLQALCEIVSGLHDTNGTVTVPGFYDHVAEPDAAERELLAAINPWYDADWQRTAAAPQPWGEAGYSIHERAGIRPTLELNGIFGKTGPFTTVKGVINSGVFLSIILYVLAELH